MRLLCTLCDTAYELELPRLEPTMRFQCYECGHQFTGEEALQAIPDTLPPAAPHLTPPAPELYKTELSVPVSPHPPRPDRATTELEVGQVAVTLLQIRAPTLDVATRPVPSVRPAADGRQTSEAVQSLRSQLRRRRLVVAAVALVAVGLFLGWLTRQALG